MRDQRPFGSNASTAPPPAPPPRPRAQPKPDLAKAKVNMKQIVIPAPSKEELKAVQAQAEKLRKSIKSCTDFDEKARAMGWAVAHSRIVYADDGSDGNVFSIKVPGMQTLTEHAPISAIVPELTPVPGELVVRKTVPSAFFGTGLAPWLTQRGVETLLIAGATTSGCVRASVVDAMCHGFRPVVMADCVGDRALAPHEANLFDIGQKYGDVVPAERVLAL
ncbi:isochorismatase family protein [Azospirillum brasilense]|uniref:isochorismatase family protein n=1 Tax=Azospirillum brasilense TaxID=192 RepID=UPI00039FF5F6|nr:isochorismatase family protein [Azospirillum brasilense]